MQAPALGPVVFEHARAALLEHLRAIALNLPELP
jgi:hypothetical protein